MRDFLDKVVALRRERRSFATATVVGRRAPVSAHLGDRAIVHEDGRMEGFIGGACSREIVRRQALEAIRTGRARLVSIRPDAAAGTSSDPEHVFVPMTCVSEGAVDVYVEPSVRPRRLVVVGATPVAEALARTAVALEYDVVRIVEEAEQRDLDSEAVPGGWALAPLESLAAAITDGGPATAALLNGPKGIAWSPEGSAVIADTENHAIRRIDLKTGVITTLIGTGVRGDGPDGDPLQCKTARPHGVFIDRAANLYVGDSEAHRVRLLKLR